MNERPKPNIEIVNLAKTLIRLQETKRIVEKNAKSIQSIDNSEGLVDQTLIAGLTKAEVNRSTSSS